MIPQLYPLSFFAHHFEVIGNGQQVQIATGVDPPAECQCSPVGGEGWATITVPQRDCRERRGRQSLPFPSVNR